MAPSPQPGAEGSPGGCPYPSEPGWARGSGRDSWGGALVEGLRVCTVHIAEPPGAEVLGCPLYPPSLGEAAATRPGPERERQAGWRPSEGGLNRLLEPASLTVDLASLAAIARQGPPLPSTPTLVVTAPTTCSARQPAPRCRLQEGPRQPNAPEGPQCRPPPWAAAARCPHRRSSWPASWTRGHLPWDGEPPSPASWTRSCEVVAAGAASPRGDTPRLASAQGGPGPPGARAEATAWPPHGPVRTAHSLSTPLPAPFPELLLSRPRCRPGVRR
ncbi:transcription initiation factor TFIID subunit 4-like [Phyllostomus hastatus]|uniref:transcription initiation factor TFIID subunit 4-like n=1 Tax=Phyllostomus hastatus TaxID=9423 RepID=UPI001E684E5A|nr:transcription initiation factor TFIID subunit 4-like [Phyllostomus hastatus]